MRIFHLLPTLVFGDAVSNDARTINRLLVQMGYRSRLYAVNTQERFCNGVVHPVNAIPKTLPSDVIIYHLSTGDRLNEALMKMAGHKLIIYHNITPAYFFVPYDQVASERISNGYRQVQALAPKAEYCIADSSYNASDLRKMGYTCPIDVVPILIPFEDYRKKPDKTVLNKYSDGHTNLLFVGRIAPNKRQEDVMRAFDCYKRRYDPTARLFLVGSYDKGDSYYRTLKAYCEKMGTKDVFFPGHISFAEILAYYSVADVFVSMSDHEGFCVPLVEAMQFGLPIVAKNTSAISETLGGGGLLLKDNSPNEAAAAIHRLVVDKELQDFLHQKQQERLQKFQEECVATCFQESFEKFLRKAGLME